MSRTLLNAINATAKTISLPAIIRGSADLSTWPGVTLGALPGSTERTANGTAMIACRNYCNTNGKYLEAPPGRYEYICTEVQNSINVGFQITKDVPGFIGGGASDRSGTRLLQYATNHPVITIGDVSANAGDMHQNSRFGGFCVGYGVTQVGQTQANAILLGRIWMSDFDPIAAITALSGTSHQPYIGLKVGASSSQFFFSNNLSSVLIQGGQANILKADANSTGCYWDNIYLGGGAPGNRVALSGNAFFANLSGREFGSVGQLNVEWTSCATDGPLRTDALALAVDHLHMEGNQLNGFDPYLVHVVQGYLHIGSMRALDNWIAAANATGTPRIFSAYDSSRIKCDQLTLRWSGGSELVASMTFALFGDATSVVGRHPLVDIHHLDVSGNTGAMNLDSTLTAAAPGAAGAIYGFNHYSFNKTRSNTEGAVIEVRNADLTVYAAHKSPQLRLKQAITAARKVIVSSNMAASGIGNVPTRLAGEVVNAVRESGATGAFDWTIRNSADAVTIITLSTANTEGSAVLDTTGLWDAS